ncbi:hypothetical protein [Streptomyces sp. NPDC101181]|uniref:hypothetical protein n=1 Tax=Streptomyces sp. NPDC101181 TaxID=3366125 RepID=UPI0038250555
MAFVEHLVGLGYRRLPPGPLVAADDDTTLFTSVAAPAWRRFLTGYPRSRPGGSVVLQWTVSTSRLMHLPSGIPPSAHRTIGAIWVGRRPYREALGGVLEALRKAHVGTGDLTFHLRAERHESPSVTAALLELGIRPEGIVRGARLPDGLVRLEPELGPCLSVRRRSGTARFGHCDAQCPCGCHVTVAHIQFAERYRTGGRITPLRQPLSEIIVFEHALTPAVDIAGLPVQGGRSIPVPALLSRLTRAIADLQPLAGNVTGRSPVLLADLASVVVLLLGDGMAPGLRGGPYVLRRMMRMIGTELALQGLSPDLMSAVIATADIAYRAPLGFPELPDRSWTYVEREQDAFQRVLTRGPDLLLRSGALSEDEGDAARQLARLWSERGVPLALSLRWCREAGVEPSLPHLARVEVE